MPENEQQRSAMWGTALALYGIFALTGAGTALLGATLPVMLVHWRLTDASAGVLFLLLFVASSCGSLVPRPNTAVTAAGASGLLGLAAFAWAVTHGRAVFVETAGFGFGLGLGLSTVTRVRLLCPPQKRMREVNRLNLVWGLGAFLCPAAANELIRHRGVRGLFFTLAAGCGIAAAGALIGSLRGEAGAKGEMEIAAGEAQSLPWLAAAAAFLVVGLESSLGAWLATYAHRMETGFAVPVEATTLFWLGLLGSRALCSTRAVRRIAERRLLLGFLAMTAAGSVLLVASPRPEMVLGAALLVGFGVGPVFPMLLAAILPRVRGNLVFVIAGGGAAAVPWLTGELSGHFGSLRVGLAAPVTAGVLLLVAGPRLAGVLEALGRDPGGP